MNQKKNINSMEKKRYVVGLGELLWDLLPSGKRLGGAPANFAYHVSQFGLKGLAISAVGQDALGEETIQELERKQLLAYIERVEYPTGRVNVQLDEAGIPLYDIQQDVAWDNIPFTEKLREIAENTQAVCFGSLAQRSPQSRVAIQAFLASLPADDDVLRIYDINLRTPFYSKEVIDLSLSAANVLKVNDEELPILANYYNLPQISPLEQCELLRQRFNLRLVIYTCGANGSYVISEEGVSSQPTPKVSVVDTVGAGDSFTASFCAALINGSPISEAHAIAVKVSAFVCTQQGAMPILPRDLLS